jgi:hypothetical protein
MDSSKASDLTRVVQDLGVSDPLKGEPLSKDATYPDILIFAAKSEKTANEFYMALAGQYRGHPLARMWEDFAKMEAGHKLKLEKEYDFVVLAINNRDPIRAVLIKLRILQWPSSARRPTRQNTNGRVPLLRAVFASGGGVTIDS